MKQKSSSVYNDNQQDFIHRRLMQTISERIKRVDEIDKQNTMMTKRIQQSESSINFYKNAQDYKKYSEFLRNSQKHRMVSNQRLKTVTCNGVGDSDKKFNTFYSLKRTKTCEDLFENDTVLQENDLNNQIIPRISSAATVGNAGDPSQFLQLRPNTAALNKRPMRAISEGYSSKNKSDHRIVLQNLEECQQRVYLDKLADAIFIEKLQENTPKDKKVKPTNTNQVEKIFEKGKEIQSSDFIFEILKAMNQIIIRGRVNVEGGAALKKKYFVKTLEKNYFLRIMIRYMTEMQQLFLFDGILQQDPSEGQDQYKVSNISSTESIEEESTITKETLRNDIFTKLINDLDIDNEKIIIKSLNPFNNNVEQKPQSSRSRSSEAKLNFHLKKNRNEIVKEETLQNYLAGKFRKLRTSLYNNLDNSLKKESSPSTNRATNQSELQETTTDEIKEELPRAKLYTPSTFSSAIQRKQNTELTNEEISEQNEQIEKSLNFFKNSKLSKYFNLYKTEPDESSERPAFNIQRHLLNKIHPQNRQSVQSEKLMSESTPIRKKHYSYDFNGTMPIHTQQPSTSKERKNHNKLLKSISKNNLIPAEDNKQEENRNLANSQVIDSSKLEQKDQPLIQVKRSSSQGNHKIKLFIMLQNKQKIKAKYYDQEEDKSDKSKMNSLLNKKNLSSQGQLLQNFLISKQTTSKSQNDTKQNSIISKVVQQQQQQQQQQPQNNSTTIKNILLDKQKNKFQ